MRKVFLALIAACLMSGMSVAQVSHGGRGPTMVGPNIRSMPQLPRNTGVSGQTATTRQSGVNTGTAPGTSVSKGKPNTKSTRPAVEVGPNAGTFDSSTKVASQN